MILLDSNILIYAALGSSDKAIELVENNSTCVSDITRIEVLGFHKILAAEVKALSAFFESTTLLSITEDIIQRAIELRQQRKMSLGDAIIAATALEEGLTLATRNTKDFKWIISLTLIDPFDVVGD